MSAINIDDGYVNVRNMGGFTSMFSLSYTNNGKRYNLNTGVITLFFSSTLTIPSTATDIFIVVYISNGLGEWVPIYNNNLQQAGIVALELYGTIWSPQYSVIKDSQPVSKAVVVYNQGGFNARLSVDYYVNEEDYKLASGSFSVGMSRNIDIPDIVQDQTVLIEIDATGMGNWISIYNDTFSDANSLDITLSGTVSAPQVDINNIPAVTLPQVSVPIGVVGGSPATTTLPVTTSTQPCSNTSAILDEYMNFMKQTHDDFLQVLNKLMNN